MIKIKSLERRAAALQKTGIEVAILRRDQGEAWTAQWSGQQRHFPTQEAAVAHLHGCLPDGSTIIIVDI